MNFTAPYRFVPLNEHVFIPHFVEGYPENISQDVPFKNGKDGSIEVEFTNITPILVAGDEKNGNTKEPQIIKKVGKEFFVISGSSWKGMIRSVMEIMSFAKIQPYDDATFGYRNVGGKNDVKYNKKMQAALCGWLRKKEDDSYYLLPCGEIKKISKNEIDDYKSIENKNIIDKLSHYNKGKKDRKDWEYPEKNGKILVFTGPINRKEHEYLFSKPESIKSQPIRIAEEVIKKFFSVYRNSPYNDEKGKRFIETWLGNGKLLPVFYLKSGDKVTDIGITRMFRLPYAHSISDFIKQDSKKEERDLVECIFGYTDTDNKSSLKGRVQFGHTLVEKGGSQLEETKGVLGEPKASFFPFYLKQQGTEAQTYDSDAEIAGRKRYAIHENKSVSELPKGNGNEKTTSHLKFVPAGRSFRLTVHFHNLLPVELGALLSAISFHDTNGIFYNIGMAKGYGYGKLELKDCTVKIDGKNVEKDEFLSCFENEMNRFCKTSWLQSEQIQALFGIASGTILEANLKTMEMEKRNNEGRINEFELCRDFKKNSGERNLRDWKPQNIKSWVDPDDQNFQTLDLCALTHLNNKDFEIAKQQFLRIISICKKEDYRVYAQNRINSIEKVQEQIVLEWECAKEFEEKGEFEEAIEHYRVYFEKSGRPVADKVAELNQKIVELKVTKAKSVVGEADQLRKSGQYAEAIEKYREYEQLTGSSKAQNILYCEEQLEKLSKPIAERLPYSSVAAFVNSLKKTLAGGSLTAEELKTIGRKLAENVKPKEKKKWQNSASQFKGILSDEQVAELLNYVK